MYICLLYLFIYPTSLSAPRSMDLCLIIFYGCVSLYYLQICLLYLSILSSTYIHHFIPLYFPKLSKKGVWNFILSIQVSTVIILYLSVSNMGFNRPFGIFSFLANLTSFLLSGLPASQPWILSLFSDLKTKHELMSSPLPHRLKFSGPLVSSGCTLLTAFFTYSGSDHLKLLIIPDYVGSISLLFPSNTVHENRNF